MITFSLKLDASLRTVAPSRLPSLVGLPLRRLRELGWSAASTLPWGDRGHFTVFPTRQGAASQGAVASFLDLFTRSRGETGVVVEASIPNAPQKEFLALVFGPDWPREHLPAGWFPAEAPGTVAVVFAGTVRQNNNVLARLETFAWSQRCSPPTITRRLL